jgi:glycosyltransferase involved in cell wall biosynthesis
VATAAGGVPEALTDGCEGRLVPVGEIAALSAAVAGIAADAGQRAAMAERGRARVERDFRLAGATRRLEAAYELWLSSAPRQLDRAC